MIFPLFLCVVCASKRRAQQQQQEPQTLVKCVIISYWICSGCDSWGNILAQWHCLENPQVDDRKRKSCWKTNTNHPLAKCQMIFPAAGRTHILAPSISHWQQFQMLRRRTNFIIAAKRHWIKMRILFGRLRWDDADFIWVVWIIHGKQIAEQKTKTKQSPCNDRDVNSANKWNYWDENERVLNTRIACLLSHCCGCSLALIVGCDMPLF